MQTSAASPKLLLNSWTAPTPSQRPRDPPKSAKNVEIENSGMKDSVISQKEIVQKPKALEDIVCKLFIH